MAVFCLLSEELLVLSVLSHRMARNTTEGIHTNDVDRGGLDYTFPVVFPNEEISSISLRQWDNVIMLRAVVDEKLPIRQVKYQGCRQLRSSQASI